MEVREITECSGITGAVEEMVDQLATETRVGEEGDQTPLVFVLYSDGSIDENRKRVTNVRAYLDTTPEEVAQNILEEVSVS